MLGTSAWGLATLFLISTAALAWAAKETVPAFSADRYLTHIKYLASPELKGRGTGSPELEKAAQYIEAQFRSFGLKPVPGHGYEQDFQVTTNARMGPANALSAGGQTLSPGRISFRSTSRPQVRPRRV